MPINFPDLSQHNNPNNAFVDSDFLRGGTRTPVADLSALYALSVKSDQLKAYATRVYVQSEGTFYLLVDINNIENSNGWVRDTIGATDITGFTYDQSSNTLSIINSTGGTLTTTINQFNGLSVENIFSATTLYGDGSGLTGINNYYTTGATLNNNVIYFDRNDQLSAYTVSLSAFSNYDVYVTGGTFNDTTRAATFMNSTGGTFIVTGFTDTKVTGFTFNQGTYDLTIKQNGQADLLVNLGILSSDMTITGGTYDINTGTVTFTNNSGGTFNVIGFATGYTDVKLSAVTFTDNNITLTQTDGSSFTTNINNFSGLTVVGNINTNGLNANTITATTISATTYLGIPSGVFASDIIVSLSGGKTVGRYTSGQTIPAAGKTAEEVFNLIARESIAPTVTLSSPTTIAFNQTAISNTLNFTKVINTLGATAATATLDWRVNNTGSYSALTNSLTATTTGHTVTAPANNGWSVYNYRYTVIDSAGASASTTTNITPSSYVAPTITGFNIGSTSRDLGNTDTTITGTINRQSNNVPMSSYIVEFQSVISGVTSAWTSIGGGSLSGSSGSINVAHTGATALVNATSIAYRVKVVDSFVPAGTTITPAGNTISFLYRSFLGYDPDDSITLPEILGLANSTLTNSKVRTINNVTASGGTYTYYAYAASAGNLTQALQGAFNVLGSFEGTGLGGGGPVLPVSPFTVSGTNSYGANVSYRVYRTNSTDAFTDVTLVFS